MRPHRFDPISGSLGLVAVAAGTLVAFDAVRSVDAGWWLALGALIVGLGLVPWSRSRDAQHETAAPTASVSPEPSS